MSCKPGCVLQALGIALAEDVPGNGNHRDCEEEEQVAKIGRGARSGIFVGNVERNLRISSTGDPEPSMWVMNGHDAS